MTAKYSIVTVADIGLIHIVMLGFYTRSDVDAFSNDLGNAIRTIKVAGKRHRTLCDVSRMKIQSQHIVRCFSGIVNGTEYRSSRLAFVTGSTLARLQTLRLTKRSDVGYFTHEAAAKSWLCDARGPHP